MNLTPRHPWNLSVADAIVLQRQLAKEIIFDKPFDPADLKIVAGVDVSVQDDLSQAAIVALSFPGMVVIETRLATLPTPFPYVPGLLSFREGPVLVKALEQLQCEPDLFLFDGMGRIHPRRIGIASHLGLWINRPTIGVGKTHFLGDYDEPGLERGDHSPLTDDGELLGAVVRTREKVKPVYISPGHLIDLPSAIDLTLRCTERYRLPEPIRKAHLAAGKMGR